MKPYENALFLSLLFFTHKDAERRMRVMDVVHVQVQGFQSTRRGMLDGE